MILVLQMNRGKQFDVTTFELVLLLLRNQCWKRSGGYTILLLSLLPVSSVFLEENEIKVRFHSLVLHRIHSFGSMDKMITK